MSIFKNRHLYWLSWGQGVLSYRFPFGVQVLQIEGAPLLFFPVLEIPLVQMDLAKKHSKENTSLLFLCHSSKAHFSAGADSEYSNCVYNISANGVCF